MNEALFKIILALVSILGTVLTYIILPYIRERIGNERLAKYKYWASMAVKCAEMMFVEQGMGEVKKDYVFNFLNNLFNKDKIVITEEQLNILIEACVKEMKLNECN